MDNLAAPFYWIAIDLMVDMKDYSVLGLQVKSTTIIWYQKKLYREMHRIKLIKRTTKINSQPKQYN